MKEKSIKLHSKKSDLFYKNRFTRTLDWRHDYGALREEADRITKLIENANKDNIDFWADYANNWVILVGHREGLYFCVNGIYKFLAKLWGSFDYHINFFQRFNEAVDDIDAVLTEKQEELQHKKATIGFNRSK